MAVRGETPASITIRIVCAGLLFLLFLWPDTSRIVPHPMGVSGSAYHRQGSLGLFRWVTIERRDGGDVPYIEPHVGSFIITLLLAAPVIAVLLASAPRLSRRHRRRRRPRDRHNPREMIPDWDRLQHLIDHPFRRRR